MKYALAALAGLAATVVATPPGCSSSYSGDFTITPVNLTTAGSKRSLFRRQMSSGTLYLTLNNGILMDNKHDTGYIASNHQFQFDNPPQAGYISDSGFSSCPNGTLGLGDTTVFFACIAVDYYNFYDTPVRSGCTPINFQINPVSGSSGGSGGATSAAGGLTDGQPTATTAVGALTDHQPTATGVGALTDHQPTATGLGALTDHQPTATGIGALTDHQPTATGIGALTDHQPTATGIGALTDHQPTATGIGALTDHQPTATAVANATASLAPYTGAATMPKVGNEFFAIAAGVVAAAML